MAAHRYWRITSTARVGGAATWGAAEIDIWEGVYGPSALRRTGWTISSTVATGSDANLVDGSVGGANNWVSGTGADQHIAFDFGLGVEVEIFRFNIWRNSTGGATSSDGLVQWSDDGSTWTTAWAYSGVAAPANVNLAAVVTDPLAPPNLASTPLALLFGELEYVLDPAGAVFSDNGVTPIANGQGVYLIENPALFTGADDFVQPSSGLRPIWREAGILGFPYLECDGTKRFEDVAWAQPSGLSSIRPFMALAVIADPARSGVPSFWGAPPTNGGKAGWYLQPGSTGAEHRMVKNQLAGGDYTSDTRLVGGGTTGFSILPFCIDNDFSISTSASNAVSTAITSANVLWNDGFSGDPHYEGDLYYMLLAETPSLVDFYIAQAFLYGKYVVGFDDPGSVVIVNPASGEVEFTGFAPTLIIDEIISVLPGSLILTGGVPTVVLDELITPGSGSLELEGGLPVIRSGITLQPGAGSLVISGNQPIVTTFQFVGASQGAAIALAEAQRDTRASLIGAVALAEIVPQSNISQMGFIALAEVIPPVAASQSAAVIVASGEPCATRRAQFWKITRRDGAVLGFTSHDRALEIDGVLYRPCDSLTPSASSSQAEVGGVGDMELAGIIASDAISAEDLQAGLYDDAYVEVLYQSWENPADTVRVLMAGWLGGVSHGEEGFRAEVVGPGGRLSQRPLTQIYTPACRWQFGDSRCTVNLDALALSGTVLSSITRGDFTASVTGAPGSAQYQAGRARWLTGPNAGAITEIKAFNDASGRIILWQPAPFRPQPGDTFDLLPGCDQLRETCRDVYSNIVNFGGFPDVPGEDAIVETPQAKY